MTVNTSGRFQVVETLVRNPGESMITKSVTGPFIDAGIDFGSDGRLGFRGRVYLSKDEVREMAENLGLFDEVRAPYEHALADDTDSRGANEAKAYADGYAAGRAENLDHLADELVDRMRARVAGGRGDSDGDAGAVAHDPAAAAPAAPVADAPVGEDADGVRVADGGDRGAKPGARRTAD